VHRLRRVLRHAARVGAAALAAVSLAGCEGVGYFGQAAWGQARLVLARRPIERVLADPATPAPLDAQLGRVLELRAFATRELGMRDARGFGSYAATGREFAVWNVVAAPEFSVEPLSWCFPVAGCVSYRGYFARESAERFAEGLAGEGYETRVYGVAAYSTLGWFEDPVLDTWVMRSERQLAALMFHELAHQVVYAPGDTAFSESFARVVEREGVRRWLAAAGRGAEYADYLRELEVDREFAALVARARERLATLYAGGLPPETMRERKREELDALRAAYARASAAWPPQYRYDRFMAGALDNARLATVANYEESVPALEALLAQQNGELPGFYAAAAEIASLPLAGRGERLDALAGSATGAVAP
jgi:predicted aminopeptidase